MAKLDDICEKLKKRLSSIDGLQEESDDPPFLEPIDIENTIDSPNEFEERESISVDVVGTSMSSGWSNCDRNGCIFRGANHYHCPKIRCYFSSNDHFVVKNHEEIFHSCELDLINFLYVHIDSNCPRVGCEMSKRRSHFHCVRCPMVDFFYSYSA
ncbi:unnamed protein product, partial [Mesorhabditis belari]|uniref:Uncharacterized protein n=1 Tax=Mesorhabditis belari TaxID=2138241 RepID=A0AAF3J5K8_9BILA